MMNLDDDLDDLEYGQMYPSVVMDTQIYPGTIFGGGDSDSDFELGPMIGDSESSDSSSESDSDDDRPLIVRASKTIDHPISGGTSLVDQKNVSFGEAARDFVSFLGKVKLTV